MPQTPPAPMRPKQPMAPRRPSPPMQPLARRTPMPPLAPLAPLQPGERRPPVLPRVASYQQLPAAPVVLPPPVVEELLAPAPVQQPQVVNLGLSQSPITNWGGLPRPPVPAQRRPVPVRRPSGTKAGAFIGIVVALVVALAAIGSRSSSGTHPFAIPSIDVSVPPLSGGGTAHRPAPHQPGQSGASAATPRSGRTLTLDGTIPGQRIRVTFTRWANDASSTDGFFGPGPGKRYVAAQFRVTNTGTVQYVDAPANGARVYDNRGHAYRATFIVSKLRQGKVFDAAVSLRPGRSAVGYLVFEVPRRARIAKVQFSQNSGLGDKATWTFVKA